MVGSMDQRISFVTLAVADLEASRRSYLRGLGSAEGLQGEGGAPFTLSRNVVTIGSKVLP